MGPDEDGDPLLAAVRRLDARQDVQDERLRALETDLRQRLQAVEVRLEQEAASGRPPLELGGAGRGLSGMISKQGRRKLSKIRTEAFEPDADWAPKMETPCMVFGNDDMYKNGISKRLNLTRSVLKEFEENHEGKWLHELLYVFDQAARETYPSTKGEAPTEDDIPSYTRDLGHDGWTLETFKNQPGAGNLSLLYVGMLRMYTGPAFQPWNFWLRYGPVVTCCTSTPYYKSDDRWPPFHPGKVFVENPMQPGTCNNCGAHKSEHTRQRMDDWSMSIAILYTAICKLAEQTIEPTTVYRGLNEGCVQLPASFVGESSSKADGMLNISRQKTMLGGVEPGCMSTTKDRQVAYTYTRGQGSMFEITFTKAGCGANVQIFSQYPKEEELLFPPCTMLSCRDSRQEKGLRVLSVDASVNPDTLLQKMVEGIDSIESVPTKFLEDLVKKAPYTEARLLENNLLKFAGAGLDESDAQSILAVIAQNKKLKVLDLRGNSTVASDDIESLEAVLKKEPLLSELASKLGAHPTCREVHFDIGSVKIIWHKEEACLKLLECTTAATFEESKWFIQLHAATLQAMPSSEVRLVCLDLSGTKIKEVFFDGSWHPGRSGSSGWMPGRERRECAPNIGTDALSYLAEKVLPLLKLEELDLSYNHIDSEAIKQFLDKAGPALSSLRTLKLNELKPGIGDSGFMAIVSALQTDLASLETLEVRGPPYDAFSAFDERTTNWCGPQPTTPLFPISHIWTRKDWQAAGYELLTSAAADRLQSGIGRLKTLDLSGQNDIWEASRKQLESTLRGAGGTVFFGRSAFYQRMTNGTTQFGDCSRTATHISQLFCIVFTLFIVLFPPLYFLSGNSNGALTFIAYVGFIVSGSFCINIGRSLWMTFCCFCTKGMEINPHLTSRGRASHGSEQVTKVVESKRALDVAAENV